MIRGDVVDNYAQLSLRFHQGRIVCIMVVSASFVTLVLVVFGRPLQSTIYRRLIR